MPRTANPVPELTGTALLLALLALATLVATVATLVALWVRLLEATMRPLRRFAPWEGLDHVDSRSADTGDLVAPPVLRTVVAARAPSPEEAPTVNVRTPAPLLATVEQQGEWVLPCPLAAALAEYAAEPRPCMFSVGWDESGPRFIDGTDAAAQPGAVARDPERGYLYAEGECCYLVSKTWYESEPPVAYDRAERLWYAEGARSVCYPLLHPAAGLTLDPLPQLPGVWYPPLLDQAGPGLIHNPPKRRRRKATTVQQ